MSEKSTVKIEEGTLVGKIVVVCGIRDPYATLRLQVVGQQWLEIVGRPVDRSNIRKLEPKVTIRMDEYSLMSVHDAVQ